MPSKTLLSFIAIRGADELASQMVNVAIGWYVYSATHDPMSLAYVGLAQFVPSIGVTLIAGHAADRLDRRKIIGVSLFIQTLCLAAFGAWSLSATPSARPVYALLFLLSCAHSFAAPSISAMLPQVVSPEEFPRAVAASSSVNQICTLAGPALGGVLFAISGPGMFAIAAALYFIALTQAFVLPKARGSAGPSSTDPSTDQGLFAGVRYIRSNRLLLSLISLDLFAVLLGGVTALLPIYAKDILAVGPVGFGCLRCAPGVGAAIVGLVLVRRKIGHGAGKLMLGCVAGFGVATVVFAISKNFWLSLLALFAAGGFDMVSMVIRQTLVQVSTPDSMRGRVSAVNWIFIGTSNQLGEFESGLTASLFGTVPAALFGGVGTLLVVALWSRMFPELLGADRLVEGAGLKAGD